MTDTSKAAIAAVVERLEGVMVIAGKSELHREAASLISALEARAEAAEALNATLQAKLREALKAMRHIKPYLVWTVGPESPSHHPTMPSAVDAFLADLRTLRETTDE